MIDFCSIPPHIQIGNIARKMDFCDQIEFEMSSKHAQNVLSLQKYKAIVEVTEIRIAKTYIEFCIKTPQGNRLTKWSKLSNLSDYPRFVVSKLLISGEIPLKTLIEICEKVHFVKNKTTLHFTWNAQPNPLIFNKLIEDHNVTRFRADGILDRHFVSQPSFKKLEAVEMRIDDILTEMLMRTKCRRLNLSQQVGSDRVVPTANLFFQDWFEKRRNIDGFRITNPSADVDEETLFSSLPFSTIWKYEDAKSYCKLLDDWHGMGGLLHLQKKDAIYTIERGDMNLMVFVRSLSGIHAQEYTNLSDVLEIKVVDPSDSVESKK